MSIKDTGITGVPPIHEDPVEHFDKCTAEVCQSKTRGGHRAYLLWNMKQAWDSMEPAEQVAIRRHYDDAEESSWNFGPLVANIIGYSPKHVKRNIDVWSRLSPEAAEAWRARRVTSDMAQGLSRHSHEAQVVLLPSMVDKKAPELPDGLREVLGLRKPRH